MRKRLSELVKNLNVAEGGEVPTFSISEAKEVHEQVMQMIENENNQLSQDTETIGTLMSFSQAINILKAGIKVARSGWNGKGMFVYLVKGRTVYVEDLKNEASFHYPLKKDVDVKLCDHIDMKAADGSIVVGWLASQTDILAEDWVVVE